MRKSTEHILVTGLALAIAVALLSINTLFISKVPQWVSSLLSTVATSIIAIAVMEFIFKTFLQKDLIKDIIANLKKAMHVPVEAVYLRRTELPPDQNPCEIVRSTRETLYVKGISFAKLLAEGFIEELDTILARKKRIDIRFLILSPTYENIVEISSLTGFSDHALRANINDFVRRLQDLQKKYPKVGYAYYDSSPTAGVWLVDPHLERGWCRIETYLYRKEQQSGRMNIIIKKQNGRAFFERLKRAIIGEYENNSPPNGGSQVLSGHHTDDRRTVSIAKGSTASPAEMESKQSDFNLTWPKDLNSLVCMSFPTTNLSEMKNFYRIHDTLKHKGIWGADKIPPRTGTGLLRLVIPSQPSSKIDLVLPRPTGFAYDNQKDRFIVACQGDNSIVEISKEGIRQLFSHTLFNHIHAIDYHNGMLAVTCSGTDSVLVFDVETGREAFRWIATENGYDKCPDGTVRTIDPKMDHRFKFYPTLRQSTHVNSVVLSRTEPNVIYVSLFHQGEIVRIHMSKSRTEEVLFRLDHPHGLKTSKSGGYIITSASSGRLYVLDSEFRHPRSYYDSGVEWLQDACDITRNEYAYGDVENCQLRVVDLPQKSLIGGYSYEAELKLYQVRSIDIENIEIFSWLKDL